MKVILLQELKGRGGEGDVIDVTRGFAVNYLLPRDIAIEATKGNLKQLELRKHVIEKRESGRLDSAEKVMAALDQHKVVISAKVGEEGQLFGSVTAQQIAEAMTARFGIEIDRRKVDLNGLIKSAGEHQVIVSIYRDAKAIVTVEVVDEKALEVAAAAEKTAKIEEVVAEDNQVEEVVQANDTETAETDAEELVEADIEA